LIFCIKKKPVKYCDFFYRFMNFVRGSHSDYLLQAPGILGMPLYTTNWSVNLVLYTRWFKYDRDKLWLVYTQSVPVIFEPPCTRKNDEFINFWVILWLSKVMGKWSQRVSM
jgi:hypothetical protein